MAVQFSTVLQTDRVSRIQTRIAAAGGTALLKLFSGAAPANCATADPSGALCTINLPTTFLTASGGTTTIAGTWTQASASGAGLPGIAASFRMYDSAGTCHVQGTVTMPGGGGDLTLVNVSLAAGQAVTITSATFTDDTSSGGASGGVPMLLAVWTPNLATQASNIATFQTYLGRNIDLTMCFLDGQPTWAQLGGAGGFGTGDMAPTAKPTIWSVPMLPINGDFLDLSASGTQDSFYTQLATTLATYAYKINGKQYVRIGWEFNSGYPWWVNQHPPFNTPANYITTFQRIVNAFRAVSSEFLFVWCGNSGNQLFGGGSPGQCYPGDAYVDVIAVDSYQHSEFSLATFAQQLNNSGGYGVNFWYNFAQNLGGMRTGSPKPFGMGEWGVCNQNVSAGTSSGTDTQGAQYIQDTWDWMNGADRGGIPRNIAYMLYWNGDIGSSYNSQLDNSQYPLAAAKFKATFGSADPVNAPAQVTGLAATGITSTGATLNWTAAPFATSYTVATTTPRNLVSSFTAGSTRNNFTGRVGVTFASSGTISVTALGVRMVAGNTTKTVSIFDASGYLVATAVVPLTGATVGNTIYTNITPVTLYASSAYFLVTDTTNAGESWVDSSPVTVPSGLINISSAFDAFGGSGLQTFAANQEYAGVDMKYNAIGSLVSTTSATTTPIIGLTTATVYSYVVIAKIGSVSGLPATPVTFTTA